METRESEPQTHDFTDLVEWARLNVSKKFGTDKPQNVERIDSGSTASTIESPFGSQLTTPVDEDVALDFGYPVVQDLVDGRLSAPFQGSSALLETENDTPKKSIEEPNICHEGDDGEADVVYAAQEFSQGPGNIEGTLITTEHMEDVSHSERTNPRFAIEKEEGCDSYENIDENVDSTANQIQSELSVECLFDAQLKEDEETFPNMRAVIGIPAFDANMYPELSNLVPNGADEEDFPDEEATGHTLVIWNVVGGNTSSEDAKDHQENEIPMTPAEPTKVASSVCSTEELHLENSSAPVSGQEGSSNYRPDVELQPSESTIFTNTFNAILRASGLPESVEDELLTPSEPSVDVVEVDEGISTHVLAASSTRSIAEDADGNCLHESGSETSPLLGTPQDRSVPVMEVETLDSPEAQALVSSHTTLEEPEVETQLSQEPPAIQLARDAVVPLGILSLKTISLYAFRAIVFIPWCCLVGGTILLAPNLLSHVAFLPMVTGMTAPTGIRRFQYWAITSAEFCTIFAGVFASLLWLMVMPFPMVQHNLPLSIAYMSSRLSFKNILQAVGLLCAVAVRAWFVWKDFEVNKDIELGEDDWQSVGMILWGDVDDLGNYKKGRGLKRSEHGGFLACLDDEDEACQYDDDVFVED